MRGRRLTGCFEVRKSGLCFFSWKLSWPCSSCGLGQPKLTQPQELPTALIKACSSFSRDLHTHTQKQKHTHRETHRSPSPPSGAVAALGPFFGGTQWSCSPRKTWGWEEGMKLVFSLALPLQGSCRHSGERFNDPLRPCFPPPRQLREALGHTSGERVGNEPL